VKTSYEVRTVRGTPVFRADTIEGAKRELERSRKRVGIEFRLFRIIETEEEVLYKDVK
jgi:hypothetical protein